ncbi:hypothetical protein JW977_00995 [Candidatus Falkowbacteria bacterium]|nr:hypothetical protein [Candidatus Falkowbacteria bacterium]
MIKDKQKLTLIENLKKVPIVQLACEKTGISRATYYRWRKASIEFAKATDQAIADGVLMINDLAESTLLSTIKDKNITSTIFWLKNRHQAYKPKIELSGTVTANNEKLTKQQENLIKTALQLSNLIIKRQNNDNSKPETK